MIIYLINEILHQVKQIYSRHYNLITQLMKVMKYIQFMSILYNFVPARFVIHK